jgi:hypothetical protein
LKANALTSYHYSPLAEMATATTATAPTAGPTPVKIGTLPVILPELTYPNSTPEEREAVKALLAESERNTNAQKAKAVAKITLSPLTPNNVGTVRKLNSVCRYPPSKKSHLSGS